MKNIKDEYKKLSVHELIKYFPNTVYGHAIHNQENSYRNVFTYNENELRGRNNIGREIYFSVNSFDLSKRHRREIDLKKLNACFGDFDICKEGESIDRVEVETTKDDLFYSLIQLEAKPHIIVVSKNGLQPIWLINESEFNGEIKNEYRRVETGLIKWSVDHGCKGDKLKHLTQVLRLPTYYHKKNPKDPYLVNAYLITPIVKRYSLNSLKNHFYVKPQEKPRHEDWQKNYKSNEWKDTKYEGFDPLEDVSTEDITVEVLKTLGYSNTTLLKDGRYACEKDEYGNWIPTGAYSGNIKGYGDFTGSSGWINSGNKITVVAKNLDISNKEAFNWICDKFNFNLDQKRSIFLKEKSVREDACRYSTSVNYLRQQGEGVWNLEKINSVLDLTIKEDYESRTLTFLSMICAYTEEDQFNILFQAPSSTGKTYVPLEVAKLFPQVDVKIIGYASPKSFFHTFGEWDEKSQSSVIDMSRKIYIFQDQPNPYLLENLRPMLSHDKKEYLALITDKNSKGNNKTKRTIIKGYSSVIFCTANLGIDEQENTRFLLLSPEISDSKTQKALALKLQAKTNPKKYKKTIESNDQRNKLKQFLIAIRDLKLEGLIINNPNLLNKEFTKNIIHLKPRHPRDLDRFMSIVKGIAMINCDTTRIKDKYLITTDEDILLASKLWQGFNASQEYDLPPYTYKIYRKVILPLLEENPEGLERKTIFSKYYSVFHRSLPDQQLRREILPILIEANLIYEKNDEKDKRKKLLFLVKDSIPLLPSLLINREEIATKFQEENNNFDESILERGQEDDF
jgi:hypothetical protein